MRHLEIILDQSGSMSQINAAAYAGARELLEDLDADGTVRLTTFNSSVTRAHTMSKAEAVDAFAPGNCSGTTALYDAICQTLNDSLTTHSESDGTGIVIAIVTDGAENASSSFTISDVRDVVARAHNKNWRVTFLGANQDAVMTAQSFGIRGDRAITYGTTDNEVRQCFRALSAANRRYDNGQSEAFTQVERSASMQESGSTMNRSIPPSVTRSSPNNIRESPVLRSSSTPATRPADVVYRWVSLDPRTGELQTYPDSIASRIDDAVRSNMSTASIHEFNATVYLVSSGKHLQKTATGERDVRRAAVGEAVYVQHFTNAGYRIVPSSNRSIIVN